MFNRETIVIAESQLNRVIIDILNHPEILTCIIELEKIFRENQIRRKQEKAQINQRKKWFTIRVEIETLVPSSRILKLVR